jgi:endo-1,4-beta-D-glucanase Y
MAAAATCDEPKVFQGIFNWAKENLTTKGESKLLLATDNKGRTVFHMAATCDEPELFQGIFSSDNENLTTEEVSKLY